MIYTITLNPAIDCTVTLEKLQTGSVNRCLGESITFGGKGINVSRVLKELGEETTVLGFMAGFTGRAIAEGLEAMGIKADLTEVSSGCTRINVKIKADDETEINADGPQISAEELSRFYEKLSQINSGDIAVLAGSVPKSVPKDIYRRILEHLSDREVSCAVDAEGELLLSVLGYRPFLIKPNICELGEIFSKQLSSDDEIAESARQLQLKGARNVLVSMGKDGSLLLDEYGNTHRAGICKGELVSSVGAGDSMLAGFLAGFRRTHDHDHALRLATACAGATAFSSGTGKKELIDELFKQL